jgi:hypothetical protein
MLESEAGCNEALCRQRYTAPYKACDALQARPGDILSQVAWMADIPLDKFMLDNTGIVKDLDAQLEGKQLLLCNPGQGRVSSAQ